MKVGLAQINTTVGDLEGNRKRILDAYHALVQRGAELVVFPEMVVCGYPPRDLLFKRRFVPDTEESMIEIASAIGEVPAVVGFAESNPNRNGRAFFNSAAWCEKGEIAAISRKCLLPTYDVFDEDRYFHPANHPTTVSFRGRKIGITICEDIWADAKVFQRTHYTRNPVDCLVEENVDLVLNLSASPWHCGKSGVRRNLVEATAKLCRASVVYCNAVGGNDELIFDGRSLVVDKDGKVTAELAAFEESLEIVDTEGPAPAESAPGTEEEEIERALVLGLRDYAIKSGFSKALIGLSGGIDSAVTATLAFHAFGKENVMGVGLPSLVSSDHSREDARALAENLGIAYREIPISEVVKAAETALDPIFHGLNPDVTEENIQARTRGLLLMAISNKFGALLLTTGNKSELAVGYCTLYGDMCGGLAVISDLPKTKVFNLARHLNRNGDLIPVSTITKPPSAELRPGQKDEDSLPAYEILDPILEGYVENGYSSRDLIAEGYDPEVVREVVRLVDLNEYKRKQAAPGLKITPLAFGVGRRIPIVQKYVS